MITSNTTLAALAGSIALVGAASAATTIIGSGSIGSNTAVPDTYGDNISAASTGQFDVSAGVDGTVGTPDIGLTYTLTGGSGGQNRWDHHAWGGAGAANNGGNGVLQIDGSAQNARHSILFTPAAGVGVVLNGFNFVGDTNGAANTYQYRVDIFDVLANSVVATQTTTTWTTDTAQNPGTNGTFAGAPSIDLSGFTGALGQEYRLDITRVSSTGVAANIAIDNLSFDQTTIPEPSSSALLGLAGVTLLLRRRR